MTSPLVVQPEAIRSPGEDYILGQVRTVMVGYREWRFGDYPVQTAVLQGPVPRGPDVRSGQDGIRDAFPRQVAQGGFLHQVRRRPAAPVERHRSAVTSVRGQEKKVSAGRDKYKGQNNEDPAPGTLRRPPAAAPD
jgi:hypothetical protein